MFKNHSTTKEYDTQPIEVNLQFLKTNEGGRVTPVKSGYRTIFHFIPDDKNDFGDWTISLQFEDEEWVKPGEKVKAYGIFLCPEPSKMVKENMRFELREGTKKVAEGEVL